MPRCCLCSLLSRALQPGLIVLICHSLAVSSHADGWHNPVLTIPNVNQFLQQATANLPIVPQSADEGSTTELRSGSNVEDLKKLSGGATKGPKTKSKTKTPARGGTLQANLNPEQQALVARAANDCLDILAYMSADNIIPREFPDFPMARMAEYRDAAKQVVSALGPYGAQEVVGRLRTLLMSGEQNAEGLQYHPEYARDLMDVLVDSIAAGRVTSTDLESLREAMQGEKPPVARAVANELKEVLPENLSLAGLFKWADGIDNEKLKSRVMTKLCERLASISTQDLKQMVADRGFQLGDLLADPAIDAKTKSLLLNKVRDLLSQFSIAGLLDLMSLEQPDIQSAAETELRARKLDYAAMKNEIQPIWSHAASDNKRVAQFANRLMELAFDDAPIGPCLYWLGQDNPTLHVVIWKQLDARIGKMDDESKSATAGLSIEALKLKDVGPPAREAALELLARLKARSAVKDLVEMLPQMDRGLWPKTGETLRRITGVDYGPKAGDGVAQVTVAVKRWREWLKSNSPP